jgi:CheY-like chemotaxis protein
MSSSRLDGTEIGTPATSVGGYPLWENPAHLVAPIPRLLINTPFFQCSVSLGFGNKWSIGRDKDNTIVLPDHLVSRQHGVIQYSLGKFSLSDLNSSNGSFVNGERIAKSTVLANGDRLIMGSTEINFQCPAQAVSKTDVGLHLKVVLMIQSSKIQGEIWREILNSQGISVIWAPTRIDVMEIFELLKELGIALPDLLLLDIGTQNANPYDFCRQFTNQYPQIKVILTSSMRTDVYESERKWAIRRGAIDLLPGFSKPNIFAQASAVTERVRTVLTALKWEPVAQNTLASTLMSLQSQGG